MSPNQQKGERQIWEDKWITTQCAMCYESCIIRVRRVNGVAVEVEGDPNTDYGSRGGLCGRGAAQLQMLYDPYRVNYPMRRTNPEKGFGVDPKWKRISWDEALDEITDRLKKIRSDNPNKLGVGMGPNHGGSHRAIWLAPFFGMAFGSINNWFIGGAGLHCGYAAHLVSGMTHCSWSVLPDFRYCNYCIYIGSNKGVGSGHSMCENIILRANAVDRGMKVVAFDPMCHQAGGKATEWIPTLPGTDLANCLAMANVLVNELGIYDAEYLKHKTDASYLVKADGHFVRDNRGEPLIWDIAKGKAKAWNEVIIEPALEGTYVVDGVECRPVFSIIREHLKQYTPEWASQISTVPVATIRRVAREFGENARIGETIEIEGVKLPYRPVAIAQFRGGQGHSNGYHGYAAADLLRQLVGACEVPGGTIAWPAKCDGYPETGLPRFQPIAARDGYSSGQNWPVGYPGTWPHVKPTSKPTSISFSDIFTCSLGGFCWSPNHQEKLHRLGIDYGIEMLITTSTNQAKTATEAQSAEERFKSIPFYVAFEIYQNETTEAFADIVLPDACVLERYELITSMIQWIFNHPTGMGEHVVASTQPVVPPMYERRDMVDVLFELVDRVGIREEYNKPINATLRGDGVPPERWVPLDSRLSHEELENWFAVAEFGPEHNLEWFKEHGYLKWPKKVQEVYWRPFSNCRAMIYSEFLLEQMENERKVCDPAGIKVEWEQYTPLTSYFPAVPHKLKDSKYDLIAYSYKDRMHTGSFTHGIPYLAEASDLDPLIYGAAINVRTAEEKGIKDGDAVWIESYLGRKIKAVACTIEGIHPQCIAIMAGAGGFARERPSFHNRGTHMSALLECDFDCVEPITLNMELAVKVRIYKKEK